MIEIRSATKILRMKDGQGGRKRLRGSALILTVVLTSLLAIVGVMFLMISRIDRMATSAISEDKQLDLAVDTVLGQIFEQLAWDVPGVNLPMSEYHDYPGPNDIWLAFSEPNIDDNGTPNPNDDEYYWPQISDVTGYLGFMGWPTQNIPIAVIPDNSPIALDLNGSLLEQLADADGDGVADSKWIPINWITSSKGEPIYAAIRITDNCGKINVNTGFQFDPNNTDVDSIDGTSLLHINLMALADRPHTPPPPDPADANALLWARANYGVNLNPYDLAMYEDNVIWQYGELPMPYTPFDISDELELRNRFLLNQNDLFPRIEQLGYPTEWTNALRMGLEVPLDSASSNPPPGMDSVDWWFDHANISRNPNLYDYHHLATTYSMDRIINPAGPALNGGRMFNINPPSALTSVDRFALRDVITAGILDANSTLPPLTAEGLAAQLAVNVIDFADNDSDVTAIWGPSGTYYGYERPCIYISEVVGIVTTDPNTGANYTNYAVELHKPYFEDDPPPPGGDWRLMIDSNGVAIDWTGSRRYHVILFEQDPNSLGAHVDFNDPCYPSPPPDPCAQNEAFIALGGETIYLQRSAELGVFITVDSYTVPAGPPPPGLPRSFRRDITLHKCIRRLWDPAPWTYPTLATATLGNNTYPYVDPDANMVQAHPYLDPNVYTNSLTGAVGFKNVGEIGMVFDVNAYNVPIGSTEADLRLDLRDDLNFARIFNYLTVFDPFDHGCPWEETRVKGRININTAPWYVLHQLPWIAPIVSPGVMDPNIVDMVVAYRDGLGMFSGLGSGFGSIGELAHVWDISGSGFPGMDYYGTDGIDQVGFPDLTPLTIPWTGDGAADDFEERDLIFHRISNLITVRSDVFTAYILVRIGADGPQRRVLAILDRSEVLPIPGPPYTTGRVRIRALHKVADPW